ncbi:MAG TPA: hypothetical protein VGU71_06230 [Candidatus Dormibacteraeota bacterium]|nr:hypothetical protein [Candidatus Dormibacteraeota bacterium]
MPDVKPASSVLQETGDRVKRAYGAAIGRHRHDLVTPALILDLPAAQRNIAKMADRLRTMPATTHIKVHKSPELARMQVAAGAIGISTATVWEAIVMVLSGLDSIFVVNTLAGREKLAAVPRSPGMQRSWSRSTTPATQLTSEPRRELQAAR